MGNEFNTQPIIQAIWQADKKCYLPVLTNDKSLVFVQYMQNTVLTPNQFNIPEPADKTKQIPATELDLVLLPLVAFDLLGNRLGAGGGYYDRTFHANTKSKLIGLAYAAQQADALVDDSWDVKLDGVLTEKSMSYFKPG